MKKTIITKTRTSYFVKSYDGQTKWMYHWAEDEDLLEKYNTIWHKVRAEIKKEFDSEPVYNKNFLKTKVKSYGDDVKDFYDKEIPKVYSNYTCLEVIRLDSALKNDENYYPQVFLKECKCIKNRVIRLINDNLSDLYSSGYSGDFDDNSFSFNRFFLFL